MKPNYKDAVSNLVGQECGGVRAGPISEINIPVGVTPPTGKEIDAKLVELISEWEANQYQRDRQYPDLGEQLDLLFHDMTAGKGTKSGEWYKAIAKVKSDNPK